MKALLLGPNGQLGTDLTSAVASGKHAGIELIPFGRAQMDVSDVESIAPALEGQDFDVVINCTSYHKTDEVEDNADMGFKVNAFAVRRLAEVCAEKKARLVHVSTDYVFSGRGQSKPYVESDGVGPLNVYGATKACGENLALIADPDSIVLRVASLFGVAGASGKGGNFVETMIKAGTARGELSVVDDITMSPTSTEDIAWMILSLLEKEASGGIYHGVNSRQATWYQFAAEIIEKAGVKATVSPCDSNAFPTKAQRPEYSVLDNSKLAKVIGEIPTWSDALDRYLKSKGHTA
ncbi:dTDP-4-dehydrorhamnose reductase [Rhodovibrionaceae bacterium A322]